MEYVSVDEYYCRACKKKGVFLAENLISPRCLDLERKFTGRSFLAGDTRNIEIQRWLLGHIKGRSVPYPSRRYALVHGGVGLYFSLRKYEENRAFGA